MRLFLILAMAFAGVSRAALKIPASFTKKLPPVEVPAARGVPAAAQSLPEFKSVEGTLRFEGEYNINGIFTRYQMSARIDKSNPAASYFDSVIDMESIESEGWMPTPFIKKILKISKYPKATVRSVAIRPGRAPDTWDAELDVYLSGERYRSVATIEVLQKAQDELRLKGSCRQVDAAQKNTIYFDVILKPAAG